MIFNRQNQNNFMNVRILIFVLLVLLWGNSVTHAQGKVLIVVSVDWEGEDLQESNLKSIQDFRRDFADIPLQNFLNAAYYTKPRADAAQVTKAIKSILRPKDEQALHIHAWRSLVESSGVRFRTFPSMVMGEVNLAGCSFDCGHEVVLTAYTNQELRKIIARSVEILQREGFDRPKSFRAGGWQANDNMLEALVAEGFSLDSSATPAEFLKPQWEQYNLYGFVRKLWSKTNSISQPYIYQTSKGQKILELPNNGCLSDYMTGDDMLKVFQENASILKKNPGKDVYVSIGFHQETATEYLPRLREAIRLIRQYSRLKKIPIEFIVPPFNRKF